MNVNTLKGFQPTPFAGLQINLHTPLDEILKLKPVPIQRDHLTRIKKMSPIFDMDLRGQKYFAIVHVTTDLKHEEYGVPLVVPAGYYVFDGNTRCEYYRNNPLQRPKEVIGSLYTIDNIGDLLDEYNGYDAMDAVETKKNKIQGALRGLQLRQRLHGKALNGGYGTALDKAYPHDVKDDIHLKVQFFAEEIVLMSEANLFEIEPEDKDDKGKYYKNAQFQAACLMFAKKHSARRNDVLKLFRDLARMAENPKHSMLDKDKLYGFSLLLRQKIYPNNDFMDLDTMKNDRFPKPISFFLFCLLAEMGHKKYDKKTLRPSLWWPIGGKNSLYRTELIELANQFPQK